MQTKRLDNRITLDQNKLESAFKAVETTLNGGTRSNFHSRRKLALSTLIDSGLPATRVEDWKYTDLRGLTGLINGYAPQDINHHPINPGQLPEALSPHRLVFIDGIFDPSSSNIELPSGVHLSHITNELKNDMSNPALEKLGELASDFVSNPICAINSAFINCGLALQADTNHECEHPIEILNFRSRTAKSSNVTNVRILITVGPQAKFSVIEHFVSESAEPHLATSVAEVFADQGSQVAFYKITRGNEHSHLLSSTNYRVKSKAEIVDCSITFSGKMTRNEVACEIAGQHSQANLLGLSLLTSSEHVDNVTIIDHAVANCESNELYKGLYAEESKGNFSGTIIVRPDAQKTNAFQQNQSILLSNSAESNSRPQLKIWADDVKCTHGATVGQLNEEALFYLRSRGIDEKRARAILIEAFASDVVEQIPDKDLRKKIEALASDRLSRLVA